MSTPNPEPRTQNHALASLLLLIAVAETAPAFAEDVTITTNYPSPTGVYNQLRTTGNMGIGTATPDPAARLTVRGAGTDGNSYGLMVKNSAGTQTLAVRDDGFVAVGTESNPDHGKLVVSDYVPGTIKSIDTPLICSMTNLCGQPYAVSFYAKNDSPSVTGNDYDTELAVAGVSIAGTGVYGEGGVGVAGRGTEFAGYFDGTVTIGDDNLDDEVFGGKLYVQDVVGIGVGFAPDGHPFGKLAVLGAYEQAITNEIAPLACSMGGHCGKQYRVSIVAQNNSPDVPAGIPGHGINSEVAIAGIRTGGASGAGLYGEGPVGIVARGTGAAAWFDGNVVIHDEQWERGARPGGRLVGNLHVVGDTTLYDFTKHPGGSDPSLGMVLAAGIAKPKLGVEGPIHSTGNRMYLTYSNPSAGANMFWFMSGPDEGGDGFAMTNPNGDNVIGWNNTPGFVGRKIGLNGEVNIGANAPGYRQDLFVTGNTGLGIAPQNAFRLYVNGNTRIDGSLNVNGSSCLGAGCVGDLAETIDCPLCEAGDVVVVDRDHDRRLRRSTNAYERPVAGVISTKPALNIGGSQAEAAKPLALAGQVPCKVTAENGPIKRGDLLVTSSKHGYAMRGDDDKIKPKGVVGMALEPLEKGEGAILILITGG